ncbi:apolipoprotein D-like [Amphiura filiformis]|uniref:apolipoprotein D-like n=1 Tax=Amphiura filiformis TaxID=82378 RepID=UPI003B216025
MKFLQQAVFLLSFLTVAQSLSFYWDWGRCPKVTVKQDFQVQEYLGTWYEISRYPAPFESFDDRCTQAVYSEDERENYIGVYNSGLRPDGSIYSVEGYAWIPDPEQPGKLKVTFSGSELFAGDYWVLDTDYDRYSLIHSCQDFLIFHTEINWILSHYRQLDDDTLQTLYNQFADQGVKTKPFQMANQEGCGEEETESVE